MKNTPRFIFNKKSDSTSAKKSWFDSGLSTAGEYFKKGKKEASAGLDSLNSWVDKNKGGWKTKAEEVKKDVKDYTKEKTEKLKKRFEKNKKKDTKTR